MSAIDLNRLKSQISGLVDSYQDPQAFSQAFHKLLGFYHRYSHRPNADAIPKTFMRTYDLPDQVVRQVELGLKQPAQDAPEATLALVRFFWQEPYFESRDMATFLLGQLPINYAGTVKETIFEWLSKTVDRAVVQSIFSKATATLQSQEPSEWEDLVNQLLSHPEEKFQNYGLYAVAMIIEKRSLVDLPVLFKMLRPFIQVGSEALQTNLSKALKALAESTPHETAYLLKQVLADTPGAAIERRMRSYLSFFPEETATSLQTAIKTHAVINR